MSATWVIAAEAGAWLPELILATALAAVCVLFALRAFRDGRAASVAAVQQAGSGGDGPPGGGGEPAQLGALGEAARQEAMAQIERNVVMFEQHRRMNELTIAKLETEIEAMRTQLREHGPDSEREEAAKEYHELMVEKARLEMDLLRLQIAEMRRRAEDWRAE